MHFLDLARMHFFIDCYLGANITINENRDRAHKQSMSAKLDFQDD